VSGQRDTIARFRPSGVCRGALEEGWRPGLCCGHERGPSRDGLNDAFYAKKELTTEHVLTALEETVPLARTMDEQINRLRSWAEGRARNASVARETQNAGNIRRMEL